MKKWFNILIIITINSFTDDSKTVHEAQVEAACLVDFFAIRIEKLLS